MKIWIPTIDDRGPEGLPSSHFGASPYFTFFDLDTGKWEAVRNPSGGHLEPGLRLRGGSIPPGEA